MVQLVNKAAAREQDDQERGYEDVHNRLELTRKYALEADLPAFNDEKPWRALVELYDSSWFERLWVVQETLATHFRISGGPGKWNDPQPGHVIIGTNKISYFEIRTAGAWMWNNGQFCKTDWNSGPARDCFSTNQVLQTGKFVGFSTNGRICFDLLTLLKNFRSRKCADARDKIYGFLSISDLHPDNAGSMASMIDNDQAKIRIDYNQTVLQVYRNAARAIIASQASKAYTRRGGGVNIISNAVPHSLETGWPSWLPDWRRKQECSDGAPVGLFSKWPAGRIGQRVHPHPDENVLVVEGILLDEINWAYEHSHIGKIVFEDDPQIPGRLIESRLGQVYQPSSLSRQEPTFKAFVLTLTAGDPLPSVVAVNGDNAEDIFADTFLKFIRAIKMPRTTEEEREARYSELGNYTPLGYDTGWSIHPHRILCHRRLFTSKDGWLGLGFEGLKIGDTLAIIFGMDNIAILRPRSNDLTADGYEYIGEAYVRGASNGELVPTFPKDENGKVIGIKLMLK